MLGLVEDDLLPSHQVISFSRLAKIQSVKRDHKTNRPEMQRLFQQSHLFATFPVHSRAAMVGSAAQRGPSSLNEVLGDWLTLPPTAMSQQRPSGGTSPICRMTAPDPPC